MGSVKGIAVDWLLPAAVILAAFLPNLNHSPSYDEVLHYVAALGILEHGDLTVAQGAYTRGALYSYLEDLFLHFSFETEGYRKEKNVLAVRFGDYLAKMRKFYDTYDKHTNFVVLDYIAGMTDDFAIDSVSEIMIPRRFENQFDDLLLK